MCLSRVCFGIWLIEQGTLLLKRACFALWHITRNYLRSVSIKHMDRTNRNTLCPDVITRCTPRMCSEYELLAMLTVCTERKLLKLFSLKMVIDSIIEMPSRFYIATRFQLFSFVKEREKLSRRQQN